MIKFRMVNIRVDQFATLSECLPPDGIINYGLNFAFKTAKEAKCIACKVDMLFSDQNNAPIVKLNLICEFEIEESSWESLVRVDKIDVPKEFLQILAAQTIGTSRGILFCKTENTKFQPLMIPPINTTEIFNKDALIEL